MLAGWGIQISNTHVAVTVDDDLLGGADVAPLWKTSVRGDGGGDMGDMFHIGQGAPLLRLTFAMPWPA